MPDGATDQSAIPMAEVPATLPKSRRRFRFSLRTLVIFVLLVGSGMGLWWWCDPWRFEHTLTGHTRDVCSVAFSPDGRRVVTASLDDTARVWDSETGKELAVLRGHTRGLFTACFSPDGARILTASLDKTARLWDATTCAQLAVLEGHRANVYHAVFSPDGRCIATVSNDWTARIWDAEKAEQKVLFAGHSGAVVDIAFSPDGQRVITGSHDRTARVWDVHNGGELLVLRGFRDAPSVAFSPDGQQVITECPGGVRVWDAQTGANLGTTSNQGVFQRPGLAFSLDGRRVARAWEHEVHVGICRQPYYRWGPLQLPEFWLALVFALAFVWSVRRDRRTL